MDLDFSWLVFFLLPEAVRARRVYCSLNKTNLPSGIGSQQKCACLHHIMPLRRGGANLLNGLLTPSSFSTMLHAPLIEQRHSTKFIGLMPPFFEGSESPDVHPPQCCYGGRVGCYALERLHPRKQDLAGKDAGAPRLQFACGEHRCEVVIPHH